jgi:8-oxo-dGTP diphosphatase
MAGGCRVHRPDPDHAPENHLTLGAAPGGGSGGAGDNPGPVVAVGAVVVRRGALLLVQRGHDPERGRWSVPGGRVRWGELLAGAVQRELREETGLDGRCGPLVGWAERRSGHYHFVILDFAVTVPDDAEAIAGSDASALAWVALDEVASWPLVEHLASFLHDAGIIPPDSASEGERRPPQP